MFESRNPFRISNDVQKKFILVVVGFAVFGLIMTPLISLNVFSQPSDDVLERVPEQAKPAIEKAQEKGQKNGLPKVMFLTTGGTIANMKNPDGTNTRIQLEDVIANIRERYPQPEVAAILDSIDPTFKEVTLVGSSAFTSEIFLTLALEAQKALDGEFDAVIVTQGTTTSEDTCYFLNLLVNTNKPIIVTNSQRQHMSVGNDGDRNLLDSIIVATHPESKGKGALQVEGAKIAGCREVLKNSNRPGAFLAQSMGMLGWLSGGTLSSPTPDIVYYREPVRKHTFTSEFSIMDLLNKDDTFKPLPRVEVLPSYYDAQVDVIDALVSLGVEGLVVQGPAPSGSAFPDQRPRLTELAENGMPIVQTSRNAGTYEGVGVQPRTGPIIGGDDLPSHKARILLQLAMDKTEGLSGDERLDEIERLFNTH